MLSVFLMPGAHLSLRANWCLYGEERWWNGYLGYRNLVVDGWVLEAWTPRLDVVKVLD